MLLISVTIESIQLSLRDYYPLERTVIMDDDDPTCVVRMIKDLRSAPSGYRRDSRMSSGLRLSSAGSSSIPSEPIVCDDDDDNGSKRTPKRARLDESKASLNRSSLDGVPSSPWEWRRLKGEVKKIRNI